MEKLNVLEENQPNKEENKMKRTKQVQIMVDEMNERLAYNRTIETGNSWFMLFSHLLMKAESYKGFNWFYKKNIGGEMVNMLVGSSDEETLIEKDGFLQFY